jgi:hypothetical protein
MTYRHKLTNKLLKLIRLDEGVGTFEIISSEVKQRHMRYGKEHCICRMSNVTKYEQVDLFQ